MFPDSNIAQKFSCGETKCTYLARFGLAPHFQQLMIKSLKESGAFVVLFDESLNNVTQSKQLDVHVRTWRNGEVPTRFLTSEFMGHATAVDLQESLRSALVGLDLSQIVQISMDGFVAFTLLNQSREHEYYLQLCLTDILYMYYTKSAS